MADEKGSLSDCEADDSTTASSRRSKHSHRYSDDDVLRAIRTQDHASANGVADELDCSRQTAHYRLKQLQDEGRVQSEKIGNTLIWTVVK